MIFFRRHLVGKFTRYYLSHINVRIYHVATCLRNDVRHYAGPGTLALALFQIQIRVYHVNDCRNRLNASVLRPEQGEDLFLSMFVNIAYYLILDVCGE